MTVEVEVPPIPTFVEGTYDLTNHGPLEPNESALGLVEGPVDPTLISPNTEVNTREPRDFQGLGHNELTAHSLSAVEQMATPIIIQIATTNSIWGEDPELFWCKTRDEFHNTLKI
jgi:hypothetical protein